MIVSCPKKPYNSSGYKDGQELNETQALLAEQLDDTEQLVRLSAEGRAEEDAVYREGLEQEAGSRNRP
ncbi:hypothetical protein CVT26_004226 [Gymnopilus dilepis]|uniref:Uncharacterized protein n=1 Tax=Gymnopilus dilepis TaxID=231916 RepID=A0A409YMV4_9AGAR|nr:hypothetical protein CVT26_004226 [Gymnopilus dilepis]